MLIDAAEQLNFLPVQDCVHIDSIAAQSIRPNSSALSEMSCGDMEIDGVVVRILVYRILSGSVLSLGRCHRAQKRIARTKDIFIACVVISTFGEVIFYQDSAALKALTRDQSDNCIPQTILQRVPLGEVVNAFGPFGMRDRRVCSRRASLESPTYFGEERQLETGRCLQSGVQRVPRSSCWRGQHFRPSGLKGACAGG